MENEKVLTDRRRRDHDARGVDQAQTGPDLGFHRDVHVQEETPHAVHHAIHEAERLLEDERQTPAPGAVPVGGADPETELRKPGVVPKIAVTRGIAPQTLEEPRRFAHAFGQCSASGGDFERARI
jgi:hypothetical protein